MIGRLLSFRIRGSSCNKLSMKIVYLLWNYNPIKIFRVSRSIIRTFHRLSKVSWMMRTRIIFRLTIATLNWTSMSKNLARSRKVQRKNYNFRSEISSSTSMKQIEVTRSPRRVWCLGRMIIMRRIPIIQNSKPWKVKGVMMADCVNQSQNKQKKMKDK